MIRRIWPVFGALLAFGLLLGTVGPVAAYNAESKFHLQLTRLDPVKCTPNTIRIRAKLTDKKGLPVYGTPVTFEFKKSKPGDTLSPTTVITDSQGRAITFVTLACVNGTRVIKATGPNKAKDTISLKLKKHDECDEDDRDGDHDDHDDHDCDDHQGDNDDHDNHHESSAAAGVVVNFGSGGGGSAAVVTTSRVAKSRPVSSTTGSSAALALLPIMPALFGLLLLGAYRRRQPRTSRPEPS